MKFRTKKAIEEQFFKFIKLHNMFLTAGGGYNLSSDGKNKSKIKGRLRVGIGVSGGPDSVCLAVLLKRYQRQLNIEPVVIHINHHLRAAESERDERFVEDLSDTCLGFKFVKYDIHITPKELRGNSPEALARDKRYASFEKSVKALRLNNIAIAHTMNDNAETILINILRGTGITGISGIPPVRACFVRPMLSLSREDVLNYLKLNNIDYVHDSTNDSPDYLRNRVRNEIMPTFIKLNPGFFYHMLCISGDLREIDEYLTVMSHQAFNDVIMQKKREILSLNLKKLLSYDRIIIKRILQIAVRTMLDTYYNPRREYIDYIMDLLMKEKDNSGRLDMFPKGLKVYKNKEELIFRNNEQRIKNS